LNNYPSSNEISSVHRPIIDLYGSRAHGFSSIRGVTILQPATGKKAGVDWLSVIAFQVIYPWPDLLLQVFNSDRMYYCSSTLSLDQ